MSSRPLSRAIVLAAGLGTRMRRKDEGAALAPAQASAADTGVKGMIPFGRPFLDYVLSALADAGLAEVCLVIAPGHQSTRDHYTALAPRRLRIVFAVQEQPLGTAHAVLAAEPFAAGRDFLVLNSDNYYPVSAFRALRELDGPGLAVFERENLLRRSNFPRERVDQYAILQVAADGFLERIVEKPDRSVSDGEEVLLSMNCWRFSPAIFEACRRVGRSPRGELELPQAVQYAISRLGMRFSALRCDEGVLDLSTRADIAPVAEALRSVEVRL